MTRLSGYLDENGVFHTPQNKYGARRTELGGRVFDSQREAQRAAELQLLERAGEIRDLRYQVRFALHAPNKASRALSPLWQPVLVCAYVADFTYYDKLAPTRLVVEDCKGHRTAEYRLKRKWMKAEYGIEIRET